MKISDDPQLAKLYDTLKLVRGGHVAVDTPDLEQKIRHRLRELTRRRTMEAAAARGDFDLYRCVGTDFPWEDCK